MKLEFFFKKDRYYLFFADAKNNNWLILSLVFLFFLLVNSLIYVTVLNVSSPDDQWFYFKIAYLLRTEGWSAIANFKGAFFTDLAQSGYGYGAGLYHLYLIPFTFFSDKILGLKLSGVFLASLVPTLSYWVIKKFNIKYSLVWVVLFFYVFGSFTFNWRLFLNRPFVLVDVLILLEMYFISKRKYWKVFIVSIVNAWWHPATFWLPMVLAVCFEVAKILHQRRVDYKNISAALLGSLSAFLLFPSHSHTFLSPLNPVKFIKTLFSFVHGLEGGPKIIEGAENYKGDIFGMLAQSNVIFGFLIFFIVLNFILYIYRRNNGADLDSNDERAILRSYVFLILIIIFLGFVFSRRFEDLLLPLVLLGSSIAFQFIVENKYFRISNVVIKKSFAYTLAIFMLIAGGNRILDLRNSIGSDQSFLKYKRAGDWMISNTQKDEIIFNTDFGQFNRLFFYDSWNRYIVGIEPKNMYEYSHEKYWLWHNITLYGVVYREGDYGKEKASEMVMGKGEKEMEDIMVKNSKEIANIIKNEFQSRYVFFDGDNYLRKELGKNDDDYVLVYTNKEDGTYIYKIN